MAAYKNFALVGYGFLASKFLSGLAQKKSLGKIDSLVVLSRSVSSFSLDMCNLLFIDILHRDRTKPKKKSLAMVPNCARSRATRILRHFKMRYVEST